MERQIHHHSSDERCCQSPGTRQFTLNDNEVTCLKCRPRIVAMVSAQGTACAETMLANDEDTPANRAEMERFYCVDGDDTPLAGSWRDCSDNDVLIERWNEAEAS